MADTLVLDLHFFIFSLAVAFLWQPRFASVCADLPLPIWAAAFPRLSDFPFFFSGSEKDDGINLGLKGFNAPS